MRKQAAFTSLQIIYRSFNDENGIFDTASNETEYFQICCYDVIECVMALEVIEKNYFRNHHSRCGTENCSVENR